MSSVNGIFHGSRTRIMTSTYAPSPISAGGARGVMVIVTGNGHGDTSSIPGQDWWHFT